MSLRLPLASILALGICSAAPAFAVERQAESPTLLEQALSAPSALILASRRQEEGAAPALKWSLKNHSPSAASDHENYYSWEVFEGPSSFTFLSAEAMRQPGALGKPAIPGKMIADWRSLFANSQMAKDSQQAWMGGILSRDGDGALFFESLLDGDSFAGPIDPFKNDIWDFLIAAGPATTRLFATTYGVEPTRSEGMQQYNATRWDAAMAASRAPGAKAVIGGFYGGTSATIVYGSAGAPAHVLDNIGLPASFEDFVMRPEFTALTGRGIANRQAEQ